jgi:hypothetical protein
MMTVRSRRLLMIGAGGRAARRGVAVHRQPRQPRLDIRRRKGCERRPRFIATALMPRSGCFRLVRGASANWESQEISDLRGGERGGVALSQRTRLFAQGRSPRQTRKPSLLELASSHGVNRGRSLEHRRAGRALLR